MIWGAKRHFKLDWKIQVPPTAPCLGLRHQQCGSNSSAGRYVMTFFFFFLLGPSTCLTTLRKKVLHTVLFCNSSIIALMSFNPVTTLRIDMLI